MAAPAPKPVIPNEIFAARMLPFIKVQPDGRSWPILLKNSLLFRAT
jgi:hypothetical protein